MENGVVLRAATGQMNHERYLQLIKEIIFSVPDIPHRNIIFDFRKAFFPTESMFEILAIAIGMAQYREMLKGKIAHVANGRDTQIQIARNIENAMALKGFNYKSFSGMDEARAWVLKWQTAGGEQDRFL